MLAIGKRNMLTVSREAVPGFYLDAGMNEEILLPNREVPEGTHPGQVLDVFIYRDSEDRLVATTAQPKAMVGDFAYLPVISVNRQIGAFLDWGLPKDLLLPFREQREPVFAGDRIVVYVHLDEKSERIIATTRLNKHLSKEKPAYAQGQAVEALIAQKTPLGYAAIVDGAHMGLLYHANLASTLDFGQRVTAYVTALRPDGKLDLQLDPSGYQRVKGLTELILEKLAANGGKLALDDNSPPEKIREVFGTSKKAFKQALGALYRKKRIDFQPPGICLAAGKTPGKR